MKLFGTLIFSFVFFVTGISQNTWNQLNNFSGTPRQGTVTFTIGNTVYVGLGWNFATFYTDFYAYDSSTDSWSAIASFPGAGRQTAVAFTIGNKAYVGTGYNGSSYFNDFYEYDPAANTWSPIANFGGAARAGAVAFSLNGTGYVGTGTGSATYYGDFWAYNPSTNTWTPKNNFGGTARRYAASFVIGNKAYVGTGQGSTGHGATFFEYDPLTDTWTPKASYPFGRSGCLTFTVGPEGYLGGGYNGSSYQTGFQKYDPVADTWTAIANFGAGNRAYGSSFSMNGYGYVCAGYSSTGLKNDVWRYSPALGYSSTQTNVTCNGGNDGSITINAFGGTPPYTYVWSPNSSETNNFANNLSAGNYTVQITDALSTTVTASIILTEPSPLVATITPGNATSFCSGDSVILSVNTASTYQWSSGANTQNITVYSAGNYAVLITDNNGCIDTSDTVAVTVFNLPTANVIANGSIVFCQGDSVELSSSLSDTYLWNTNESTQNIFVDSSGSYSVTVTDMNGCSQTSSAIVITVNPLSDANLMANGFTSFCMGDSVQLSVDVASSYQWSTTETTQQIFVSTTGSYFVTITDANGCESPVDSITVTVFSLPATPIISVNGSVLTSSSGSGNQWYLDGNLISGATGQNYNVIQNGVYTVEVADGNGCTSVSAPFNFTNLTIWENTNETSVKIYPNPNNGEFIFHIQSLSREKDLYSGFIIDSQGNVVYNLNSVSVGDYTIDLSKLSSGIYHWVVFNEFNRMSGIFLIGK